MNYLVAVVPDRIQAEAAYVALESAGLPKSQYDIVGRGYKSADDYGFIDPTFQARQGVKRLLFWLLPFGFLSGYAFNLLTSIELIPLLGGIGNHILGGLFGTVAAGMGAFFVGGGAGLVLGSGDALPYRNDLAAGKYLIVVNGSADLIKQATAVFRANASSSGQEERQILVVPSRFEVFSVDDSLSGSLLSQKIKFPSPD